MNRKLDKVDLKIMKSLTRDTRQSITQLAKDAGVSRPTVINRLNKLTSENILDFTSSINIGKLGFRVACIAIEVKGVDLRNDFEKHIINCPRVFMLLRLSERVNFLVGVFAENQKTLKSTIESLRDFPGTNIIDVHHSEPPFSAYNLQIYPEKSDISPCGKKCNDCYQYQIDNCLGCPAVIEYKGSLG